MNGRERVRKGADEGRRMRWEGSVEEDRRGEIFYQLRFSFKWYLPNLHYCPNS